MSHSSLCFEWLKKSDSILDLNVRRKVEIVALLKLLHVQVLLLCMVEVERQKQAMKSCVFVVGLGPRIVEQVMSQITRMEGFDVDQSMALQ